MQTTVQVLRIFLSSPGDVAEERLVARSVIDQLMYDPFLRGRVLLELVAWDVGPVSVPMLASQTPQSSVNQALPRPSECDIVLVLLWGRLGTPLPAATFARADGSPFASGTQWEFDDAMDSARQTGAPSVLLYRKSAPVLYDLRAADTSERMSQLLGVDAFFDRLNDPATGSILQGVNSFASPEEFRKLLEAHLRELVFRLVDGHALRANQPPSAPLWTGSPFPGLRSFTDEDAPIYFGRGEQVDELVARVGQDSFVAVVGASGSGKSSLVGAGLLPRLAGGAVAGSSEWWLPSYVPRLRQWGGMFFTPGELGGDPFIVFAQRLSQATGEPVGALASRLKSDHHAVGDIVRAHTQGLGPNSTALVVVDQFEELFSLVDEPHRQPFIDLLASLSDSGAARVVITLRSDFYPLCLEIPQLARLLRQGHLPLAAPTDDLLEMIVKPAARAGLEFDDGLAARILADAGRTSGSLPLLAYTLDELYRDRDGSGRLTIEGYERLGGVAGAIGARAQEAYLTLPDAVRATFRAVFSRLVDVADGDRLIRRRCPMAVAATTDAERSLVAAFIAARLLEVSAGEGDRPVVSVAHEALYSSWPLLADWLESIHADLLLLHRVRVAAAEWEANGRDESYLWPQERLDSVERARTALPQNFDNGVEEFLRPEYLRLIARLSDPSAPVHQRRSTADRLVELSPGSIPELVGCLTSAIEDVREVAASALARIGTAATSAVLPLLGHADADVRLAAIAAIAGATPVPTAALLPLLSDADTRVRSMSAGVIERSGGSDRLVVLTRLAGGDIDERWRAAGQLGALGADGVGPLVDLVEDHNPRIRQQARLAIRAVGTAGVPRLLAELRGTVPSRRSGAIELLSSIGHEAVPLLLDAGEDALIRPALIEVLSRLGPAAVTALLDGAEHATDEGRRAVAVAALLDISTMAAIFGMVERGLLTSDALG